MRRQVQVIVALVAATCVLAVLVSPLVPSPFTTLRSHHGIATLQAMVSAGAVLSLPLAAGPSTLPEHRLAWRPSGAELIALTCVRLC